jgi:DNA-binding protein H-NS
MAGGAIQGKRFLAEAQELNPTDRQGGRMRKLLMAALILGLSAPALVAGSGKEGPDAKPPAEAKPAARAGSGTAAVEPITASELQQKWEELSRVVEAQKRELDEQRERLKQQQQQTQALEDQLKATNGAGRNSSAGGTPASGSGSAGLASQPVVAAAAANPEPQTAEGPLAIRYKGIQITPGGFLAAEGVWRQHALSADVNTPFNSIPFPASSQSKISEFNASARQSRITLKAEGKLKSTKLTGYYEADWLSAGVTSNNNESNSYTFRQRQIWGQAALDSGWTFTGGQMWSLVTETTKGVNNLSEASPMTIDAQYTAGFSWARQFGFRVSKDFGNKIWLAASVENPQTTFGGHGFASNFLIGAAGNGGGLYNPTANYSFNVAPDVIVKAAFEPGWGHYEVFAVVSFFRSRIFPDAPASAAGANNNTVTGGGIGANARVSVLNKKVDLGIHFLGGDGINRYGTTGLPDATVHPDGTLALIRGGQALGTLQLHPLSSTDFYFNVGGEYAARASYTDSAGKGVGYGSILFNNTDCFVEALPSNQFTPGSPSTCTGDTRNIIEGTFGFWHRFYRGPKGTLQWGSQYSYVVRNTWSGTGGAPHGIENMIFTSFRYNLP